jgi:hypothetical protein
LTKLSHSFIIAAALLCFPAFNQQALRELYSIRKPALCLPTTLHCISHLNFIIRHHRYKQNEVYCLHFVSSFSLSDRGFRGRRRHRATEPKCFPNSGQAEGCDGLPPRVCIHQSWFSVISDNISTMKCASGDCCTTGTSCCPVSQGGGCCPAGEYPVLRQQTRAYSMLFRLSLV